MPLGFFVSQLLDFTWFARGYTTGES